MRQLGMFAKYWRAGAVKTRLATAIGDQRASEIYHALLNALARRLRSAGDHRVIVYTPQTHRSEFASLAGGDWSLKPQAAGDLGWRMSQFFASALASRGGSVVLVGSDSPTLPLEYVDRAFELLREVPVVLGPARDGGYYLIGMSRHIPCMFADIAWSSSQVWEQTVSRLRGAGCPFAALPLWYDVDNLDDLRALQADLIEMGDRDDVLCELRQAIETLLPELLSEPDAGS
jgi:rSAM/selenodomain-associated transferase 1